MDMQPKGERVRRLATLPDGTVRPLPLARIHLSANTFDSRVEFADGLDGKDAFRIEIVHQMAEEPVVRVHLYIDKEIGKPDVRVVELPFSDVEFTGVVQSLPFFSPFEEMRKVARQEAASEARRTGILTVAGVA